MAKTYIFIILKLSLSSKLIEDIYKIFLETFELINETSDCLSYNLNFNLLTLAGWNLRFDIN